MVTKLLGFGSGVTKFVFACSNRGGHFLNATVSRERTCTGLCFALPLRGSGLLSMSSRTSAYPRLAATAVLTAGLVSASLAAGCVSETTEEISGETQASRTTSPLVSANALELQEPARGFVLESEGVWVESGDDVRTCEVAAVPGDARDLYYVHRIEAVLSAHSDDLIVRAAKLDSDTASAMDPGVHVPCTRAGEVFGEELSDVLRSQGRHTDAQFAPGVAQVLRGGQKLALEYHVVNRGRDATLAQVKLAFHTMDERDVQHRLHVASFENFTLYTPPHGSSSHVGECRVKQALVVSELVRRTQLYGTTFRVWRAGGDRDGELIWESSSRQYSRLEMSTPLELQPGDGFRFQCDYDNPTARELRYGVSADDETCMLDTLFWLVDESQEPIAENCLLFNVDSDGIARPRW